MSSNSFALVKLKMTMLPAGFPVALCGAAIQFCDRHSNRKISAFELLTLVVDAVDVLDVSVSETVAFPPGEHLAFSGITCTLCIIASSLNFSLA